MQIAVQRVSRKFQEVPMQKIDEENIFSCRPNYQRICSWAFVVLITDITMPAVVRAAGTDDSSCFSRCRGVKIMTSVS